MRQRCTMAQCHTTQLTHATLAKGHITQFTRAPPSLYGSAARIKIDYFARGTNARAEQYFCRTMLVYEKAETNGLLPTADKALVTEIIPWYTTVYLFKVKGRRLRFSLYQL